MTNSNLVLSCKGITHLIGVDGGGTATRVVLANWHGAELARSSSGPSGLINGVEFAWQSILNAVASAFDKFGQPMPPLSNMAIGLGLAGVHNKQWAANFAEKNPGFGKMKLETDAYTALLGAHQGAPGMIVALGTGSVGEALLLDGSRCEVGGWGFPSGDEAGGAWLGLRAVNHAQQVLDCRVVANVFSEAVIAHCGGGRDALFAWMADASQHNYAQLAPLVVAHAAQKNSVADDIMQQAAMEIMRMIGALDTRAELPIALCGSLAKSFESYLPTSLKQRLVAPHADAVAGALLLINEAIKKNESFTSGQS